MDADKASYEALDDQPIACLLQQAYNKPIELLQSYDVDNMASIIVLALHCLLIQCGFLIVNHDPQLVIGSRSSDGVLLEASFRPPRSWNRLSPTEWHFNYKFKEIENIFQVIFSQLPNSDRLLVYAREMNNSNNIQQLGLHVDKYFKQTNLNTDLWEHVLQNDVALYNHLQEHIAKPLLQKSVYKYSKQGLVKLENLLDLQSLVQNLKVQRDQNSTQYVDDQNNDFQIQSQHVQQYKQNDAESYGRPRSNEEYNQDAAQINLNPTVSTLKINGNNTHQKQVQRNVIGNDRKEEQSQDQSITQNKIIQDQSIRSSIQNESSYIKGNPISNLYKKTIQKIQSTNKSTWVQVGLLVLVSSVLGLKLLPKGK